MTQIAQKQSKCLTCRRPLIAGERVACSTCVQRVKTAGTSAVRFATHVGAAAAGDILRREFPATFKTLEAGYQSWQSAEARRAGAGQTNGARTVIDMGAARAKKAGS